MREFKRDSYLVFSNVPVFWELLLGVINKKKIMEKMCFNILNDEKILPKSIRLLVFFLAEIDCI